MRNLWLITREDFLNLLKNPMWLFYATGFPVLLVIIMGYLTRNAYGNLATSYDYYGITLMIYSALNSGMTSANAFMEERIKKPNMRMIYAPGPERNIYLSKIIASFLFSYLFHVLDLVLLELLFDVNLGSVGWLLLLLALTELFAVTLGVMLCCLVKSEAMTNQLQSIVINILAVLGGLLFSLDGYGKFARAISRCSPVKWVADAAFQMIYDQNLHLLIPVAASTAVIIAGMLLICSKAFKKEDCIC